MATYFYLPVPTAEVDQMAAHWNRGRTKKNKAPHMVLRAHFTGFAKGLRRIQFGALRGVKADDRVHLLTHGLGPSSQRNTPATHIGNNRTVQHVGGFMTEWTGSNLKAYSPAQLARHLQEEGLTTAFSDLHLFSCSAGAPQGDQMSFAQQLRNALYHRGYTRIMVTAYDGDLSAQYKRRHVPERGDYPPSAHNDQFTQGKFRGVWQNGELVPHRLGRVVF